MEGEKLFMVQIMILSGIWAFQILLKLIILSRDFKKRLKNEKRYKLLWVTNNYILIMIPMFILHLYVIKKVPDFELVPEIIFMLEIFLVIVMVYCLFFDIELVFCKEFIAFTVLHVFTIILVVVFIRCSDIETLPRQALEMSIFRIC